MVTLEEEVPSDLNHCMIRASDGYSFRFGYDACCYRAFVF